MRKIQKNHKKILLILLMIFCLSIFLPQIIISGFFAYDIYTIEKIEEIKNNKVALVFGAGVKRNGEPSEMLKDRITTAVDMYHAGKVDKLLMTGDNGSENYNEVIPMKNTALKLGVPEEDIALDYAGFSTYESCVRAKKIFQLDEVVAISQQFHLPRIRYLCERQGIDTVGVIADRQNYSNIERMKIREFLAKIKAVLQTEILKSNPRYLGKIENIFEK